MSGGTESGSIWVAVVPRLGCSGAFSDGGITGGDDKGCTDEVDMPDRSFVARGPTTRARHSSGAKDQFLVEQQIIKWPPHTKYRHCELREVVRCAAICSFVEVWPCSFGSSGRLAEVVTRLQSHRVSQHTLEWKFRTCGHRPSLPLRRLALPLESKRPSHTFSQALGRWHAVLVLPTSVRYNPGVSRYYRTENGTYFA